MRSDAGVHVGESASSIRCYASLPTAGSSPPRGRVIDPFAGGSVRGIVAASLGRSYAGNDLSAAQVQANEEQADDFAGRGILTAPTCPGPWATPPTGLPTLSRSPPT